MKITKQQIDVIASAMAREICDADTSYERAKKEAQPYLKDFKKSKFYKDLEAMFKLSWVEYVWIKHSNFKVFCPMLDIDIRSTWADSYRSIEEVITTLENKMICALKWPTPIESKVKDKIVFELTLKSLGAEDIYAVLDEVKESIKKEFNIK